MVVAQSVYMDGMGTSTCNENCTREAAFCLVRRASASAHALPANRAEPGCSLDLLPWIKGRHPRRSRSNEASPRMPAADQQPPV